jgi:hypothetical protein
LNGEEFYHHNADRETFVCSAFHLHLPSNESASDEGGVGKLEGHLHLGMARRGIHCVLHTARDSREDWMRLRWSDQSFLKVVVVAGKYIRRVTEQSILPSDMV